MPRIYITGGRQKPSALLTRDEWNAYEKAVVIELNTETGDARCVLEYQSAPELCPPRGASHVFKAGAWDGDQLLLCTQTEVVWFNPRSHTVTQRLSHPWMNDVHHVERIDGRLHVVSTGLDSVLEFEEDDRTLATLHSVTGDTPWVRFSEEPARGFSQDTDFRRVPTTKPHPCHANYIHFDGGQRWVSRFQQRNAVCIETGATTARISDAPIHDGVVDGDHTWFTVVSGSVVALDRTTHQISARYDLDHIGREGGHPLGWVRGILRHRPHNQPVQTLLAFSRLRPTKLKQNLAWLRRPLGKAPEPKPTRIAAYDLEGGRKLREWVVEKAGVSSIFSILPARPEGA